MDGNNSLILRKHLLLKQTIYSIALLRNNCFNVRSSDGHGIIGKSFLTQPFKQRWCLNWGFLREIFIWLNHKENFVVGAYSSLKKRNVLGGIKIIGRLNRGILTLRC